MENFQKIQKRDLEKLASKNCAFNSFSLTYLHKSTVSLVLKYEFSFQVVTLTPWVAFRTFFGIVFPEAAG